MILKTYTRMLTSDLDATLRILQPLHHGGVHMRFQFGDWTLVGIGDILIVAGSEESLAPIRGTFGPWVVDDLDDTIAHLTGAGAEIVKPVAPSQTGRFCYVRHPDGAVVEYVEWTADLVERFIDLPHRAGLLSSQS